MVGRRPVVRRPEHGGDGEQATAGLLHVEEGRGAAHDVNSSTRDDDSSSRPPGDPSSKQAAAGLLRTASLKGAQMMAALGSRSVEVDDVEPAPNDHSDEAEARRRRRRRRSLVHRIVKFWCTVFESKQAKVQTKGQFDDRYSDNINYFDPEAFLRETGIDILEGVEKTDLPPAYSRCRYCWSWAWTAIVLLTIKLLLCAPLSCMPFSIGRAARKGVKGSIKTIKLVTVGFPGYGEWRVQTSMHHP